MTMPAPTPSLAEIYTKLRLPAATPIRDSPYAAKFASLSTYTGTLNAVRNGDVISTPSHPGRMPGIAMVWSLVATGAATATDADQLAGFGVDAAQGLIDEQHGAFQRCVRLVAQRQGERVLSDD